MAKCVVAANYINTSAIISYSSAISTSILEQNDVFIYYSYTLFLSVLLTAVVCFAELFYFISWCRLMHRSGVLLGN